MYKVVIKKSAEKQVKKQQANIQKAFNEWVENDLTTKPHEANDGKMKNAVYENKPVLKKRFGTYRALYTIDDQTVIVEIFKFKSRGQIYKK